MALVLKDRVKETTTTTGTGTVTLAGAVAGFDAFSVVGDGNTTYYAIVAQTPGEWEVGIGTYTSSGTTLSRDTVLASSNSGAAVNFSAGTKDVFVTYPAGTAVVASDNPGTSGQVLTSNGSGVAPTWEDSPSPVLYAENPVSPTAPSATGTNAVAIGSNSVANAINSFAFGTDATANALNSVAFGLGTLASQTNAIAFGNAAVASATGAVAIGANTDATNNKSLALGDGAQASAPSGVAIGQTTAGSGAIAALGTSAFSFASYGSGLNSVSMGTNNTTTTYGAQSVSSIAMGFLSKATDMASVSIGANTLSSAEGSISLGYYNTASGIASAAIGGFSADATADEAVAIGGDGAFSGNTVASGLGAFAVCGAQASGNNSIAIGSSASAANTNAIGINGNSQSLYSTAIGYNSGNTRAQTVTGSGAMALGGSYASGTDSFAAAIANNTSSYGAKAANAVAIGYQSVATLQAGVSIGYGNTASNSYAAAIGGLNCTASGQSSFATGEYTVAGQRGKVAFGASQSGVLQQGGFLVLRNFTSDATPKVLYAGGSTVGAQQVILPNNSAYAFHGTIVARQQASQGTASAAWKVEGLIRREGSAGTTVLVNSALTVIDNTPGWTLALSADTTNGGLAITATGAAATNIRWVSTIQTSEVTYA